MSSFPGWINQGGGNGTVDVPVYTTAGLPAPTAGLLAKLSDGNRGLVYANGTSWVPTEGSETYLFENFGGRPNDSSSGARTANVAAWSAIMTAVGVGAVGGKGKVVFNGANYYFAGPIYPTSSVLIEGVLAGATGQPGTSLYFPPTGPGIKFAFGALNPLGGDATGAQLKNVHIEHDNSLPIWTATTSIPTGHAVRPTTYWTGYVFINTGSTGTTGGSEPVWPDGLTTISETLPAPFADGSVTWTPILCPLVYVLAQCVIENVSVFNGFGDGFRIYGDTVNSETDSAVFRNIRINACQSAGVCINGLEAQIMDFFTLFSSHNGTWGVIDLTGIGNHFYGLDCSYNGENYFSVTPSTAYTNETVIPPLDANYSLHGAQNGRGYKCTTPGTTTSTPPAFSAWPMTIGSTITWGTATFTCVTKWWGGGFELENDFVFGLYNESNGGSDYYGGNAAVWGQVNADLSPNQDPSPDSIGALDHGYNRTPFSMLSKYWSALYQLQILIGGRNVLQGSMQEWILNDASNVLYTSLSLGYTNGLFQFSIDDHANGIAFSVSTPKQANIPTGSFLLGANGAYGGNNNNFNWAVASPPTSAVRGDLILNENFSTGSSGTINNNPWGWACDHSDNAGAATFTPLASRRQAQLLQQSNHAMTVNDTGTWYESKASGVRVDVTAVGDHIGVTGGLLVSDSNGMRLVAPGGGYQINYGGLFSAAGGYFESTQIGATIEWVSDTSSHGIKVLGLTGAWNIDGVPIDVPLIPETVNYTILLSNQGATFTNAGASGAVVLTLPAATLRASYSFSVDTAQQLQISAVGSDVIRLGTSQSAGGGNLKSSTVGSSLVLRCTSAGVWTTIGGAAGTWTVT